MNINGCANCEAHGWKQVEDLTTLQRCKRCKVIQYCGRDCQREHWLKVHHKHCKYFADPSKAQEWDHREEDCVICRLSAVVGKSQLKRPDNPNYECIFEEVKKAPTHLYRDPCLYHPHPFPITGNPGDTYEKGIIVLCQLLQKFQLIHPGVVSNCGREWVEMLARLAAMRLDIWRFQKFSPRSQIHRCGLLCNISLFATFEKVEECGITADLLELWDIILIISSMLADVFTLENLNVLINPLADMPSELHTIMSQGVNNSAKFLAIAQQVLDALTTQVIPYRDVLMIICSGNLNQTCNFCSKKTLIANVNSVGPEGPTVLLDGLSMGIYSCEGYNCLEKLDAMIEEHVRFHTASLLAVQARKSTRCDFCQKLPPSADVHRCSRCLSVMYCGTDCKDQDWKIHKEFCKEDVEERKKKFGRSARRKEASETLEEIEKRFKEGNAQEACEILSKFKL